MNNVYTYWRKFFEQVDEWMEEDGLKITVDINSFKEFTKQLNLNRNAVIKKHISSTHTWVKGKDRWSKKMDNWHRSPVECKVCGIGASDWEEAGYVGEESFEIDLSKGELPSRDMHGHYLHRTCEEVQAAKAKHRKSRKGGKCLQCGSYDCMDNRNY